VILLGDIPERIAMLHRDRLIIVILRRSILCAPRISVRFGVSHALLKVSARRIV
jgi:hypothetical protein